MKYEIIKGSAKDFEGAPEWAIVLLKHLNGRCVFAEGKSEGCKRTNMYSAGDIFIIAPKEYEIIAERRPITEPVVNQQLTTEWSGEGLPPVGAECEITRGAGWFPVTIKFISDYFTVILTRGGTEDSHQTSALQFRPVPTQTPENMARDEAIKALDYAIELADFCDTTYSSKIYDAIAAGKIPGITKTPTVSELMRVTENATREDCEAIVKMLSGK